MPSLADAAAAAARELELEYAKAEQREILLTETERWARDPIGWINNHVIVASFLGGDTADRQRIRAVRMTMFPEQEATIDAWINLDHLSATGEALFRNVVIEKSRQIGETVGLAATLDWLLQYHRITGLCMHLKLEKIDDGGRASTWESLFGKVRYIDRHLDREKLSTAAHLVFKQKPSLIENPVSGSVVHGKGQDDDPGRGDSLDFAIVDEAAIIRHGERVHQSLASACPNGKVYLSTPFGDDNMHARIAEAKPQGWAYLRLHWSNHPVYSLGKHVAAALDEQTGELVSPGLDDCPLCAGNRAGVTWEATEPRAHRYPGKLASPWYDREIIDKTDEQVAAEYDIDREGALSARVYPEFQTEKHVVEGGIPFDEAYPIELAWDYGLDTTSIVVLQDAHYELRAIGLLEIGTQHGTSAVPHLVTAALREYLVQLGVQRRLMTPLWTRQILGYGDPSGTGGALTTATSVVQEYGNLGFVIRSPPRRLTARVDPSILAVKRLLIGVPKQIRVCGVNAAELARHFRNNTWEIDAITQKPRKNPHLNDDIHNHSMRAIAYYSVAKFPPPVEHGDDEPPAASRDARRRRDHGVGNRLGYGSRL